MAKRKPEITGNENLLAGKSLQQIANCLAYLIVHTDELKDKPNRDLIPILASLGFDRNAIAAVLQTNAPTVSVRLSQLKAEAKGKKVDKTEPETSPS